MEADFIESITAGDLTPKEAMDARFYQPKLQVKLTDMKQVEESRL